MKTIKLLSLSIAALFALNACVLDSTPTKDSKPATEVRTAASEDRPDVDNLAVNDPADDGADETAKAPNSCLPAESSCTVGADCCSNHCCIGSNKCADPVEIAFSGGRDCY